MKTTVTNLKQLEFKFIDNKHNIFENNNQTEAKLNE